MAEPSKTNKERLKEITDGIEAGIKELFNQTDSQTTFVLWGDFTSTACQYYGIETGQNSFGYIASWSEGRDLKELRDSLETINRTAGELISGIDKALEEICKERGIDLSSIRTEAPAPEPVKEETPEVPEAAEAPVTTEVQETMEVPEPVESERPSEILLFVDNSVYLHSVIHSASPPSMRVLQLFCCAGFLCQYR